MEVRPGRGRRPDRAERRREDDAHRRGDRLRAGRRADRSRSTVSRIDRLNATQRARLGLRRSFQSLELFEDVSVEENIRAGSDLRASRLSWVTDLFWPGHHDLPPTAVAAVREFELEPHLDETPEELPYGRRRLVGIARTVASGPSIVMLDEPAAGLDENESAELARLSGGSPTSATWACCSSSTTSAW